MKNFNDLKTFWKKKINVSFLSLCFCLFLILFPIDSALGNIIGSMSINNYVAIFCVIVVFFHLRKQRIEITDLSRYLLFYVIFQAITLTYSPLPLTSRNLIVIFYCFFAVMMGMGGWTEREKKIMLLSILLGALLAFLVIYLNGLGTSGRTYVKITTKIDQNYLTANFIFATVLFTNCAFKSKFNLTFWGLIILEFVIILFLGSRGSLIGNLIAFLTVALFNVKGLNKILIFLALCFAYLLLTSGLFPAWITERFSIENIIFSTGSGRTKLWKSFWDKFTTGNWKNILFGFGRGAIYDYGGVAPANNCTHSLYLKIIFESGILGISLFATLLCFITRHIIKNKNLTLFGILCGYLACGIFLDLDDYRVAYLVYSLILIFKKSNFILFEQNTLTPFKLLKNKI